MSRYMSRCMRRYMIRCFFCTVFMLILLFSGCAKQQVSAVSDFNWTTASSGAYLIDRQPLFYGIGQASGIRSTTLLRATADNQAQTQMARLIRRYMAQLTQAAGVGVADEDTLLALSELAQAALGQASIVDHYYDSQTGTFFTLCRLELEQVKALIAAGAGLDGPVRNAMLAHSDSVYSAMVSMP